MALFRRKRTVDLGRYDPPTSFPEVAVDDLIDEGVMIAASAVRMAVKNRAIVRTLRDGESFDIDWYTGAVREQLRMLAAEKNDDAARVAVQEDAPGWADPTAAHYEPDRLTRRTNLLLGVAYRLEQLTADSAWVGTQAWGSRDAALDDIGDAALAQTQPGAALSRAQPGAAPERLLDDEGRARALEGLRAELALLGQSE